jgi:hypothetical protein
MRGSLLRISRHQRHPGPHFPVEGDLEGVRPGARERDVEHQDGPGFHVHDAGRRLAELHGSLSAQQLGSGLVHEFDSDGVHPDLRSPAAHPQHEVGSGADRREAGQPDVLKDAEDAELSLLVDEGVVGDESEVEMQCQATRM